MKHLRILSRLSGGVLGPLIPVVAVVAIGLASASLTVISGFLVAATVAAAE